MSGGSGVSNLLRTRRWTLDEDSNRRVEDIKALERDRYNFEIRQSITSDRRFMYGSSLDRRPRIALWP
jgi:hypothetical protein